ncbi:MAG: sigma-70 family RNA polymerase sigma factor [Nitrospirae bacterium]|nr:sigma-70 family RNA polymerase sigma factor [Nitrospirota bacterium]
MFSVIMAPGSGQRVILVREADLFVLSYLLMEPAVFFEENLKHIEAAIRALCGRHGIMRSECEELSSYIICRLIENDYQIIRSFRNKSSFKTYLHTVIARIFIDHVRKNAGRWRPSEQAKKIGTVAVKLEELLGKDHYTIDEAFHILTTNHHFSITRDELHAMARSLPSRTSQRLTDAGEAPLEHMSTTQDSPDQMLIERAAAELREKLEMLLEEIRRSMSAEDRLMLKLRFEDDLPVSGIARMLGIDRNRVERRLKAIINIFKEGILSKGMSMNDARDLLDSIE